MRGCLYTWCDAWYDSLHWYDLKCELQELTLSTLSPTFVSIALHLYTLWSPVCKFSSLLSLQDTTISTKYSETILTLLGVTMMNYVVQELNIWNLFYFLYPFWFHNFFPFWWTKENFSLLMHIILLISSFSGLPPQLQK